MRSVGVIICHDAGVSVPHHYSPQPQHEHDAVFREATYHDTPSHLQLDLPSPRHLHDSPPRLIVPPRPFLLLRLPPRVLKIKVSPPFLRYTALASNDLTVIFLMYFLFLTNFLQNSSLKSDHQWSLVGH